MPARTLAKPLHREGIIPRRQSPGDALEAPTLKAGDRALIESERWWYDCEIVEISESGEKCTARFLDTGDEEHAVDIKSRIRPVEPPMPLADGQKVEVLFEGEWYDASVVAVSDDGSTCTAKYDDGGDEEPDVDVRRRVRACRIPLSSLEVGSKHKGKVKTIMDWGAFVDIGAECDGLVHISRIAKERISDVWEYLYEGQEVEVFVSTVPEDGKLGLSMIEEKVGRRKVEKVEGGDVKRFLDYGRDDWITATVVSVMSYGAFVRAPSPDGSFMADGLLHIKNMREDGQVEYIYDEVNVGQEVRVRVDGLRNNKLSFSKIPWTKPAYDIEDFKDIPVGTWLKGTVQKYLSRKTAGLVILVSTPDGASKFPGVMTLAEAGDEFYKGPEDVALVGDEVECWLQRVDVPNQRMLLSMRERQ